MFGAEAMVIGLSLIIIILNYFIAPFYSFIGWFFVGGYPKCKCPLGRFSKRREDF